MINDLSIGTAVLSAIILFIFGLEHFSKEVQKVTGERFKQFIQKFTSVPFVGWILGALITAVIQSSSATSAITIGLVNAGILTFKNSLGIIFGANVGTTVTAQLIAFKLTAFAPIFIIIGFFVSLFKRYKYSFLGKSIFYFGFVFFSLNLISQGITPLQSDERLINFLMSSQNIFMSIGLGAVVAAVVQSSSVVTGLAVIFVQSHILSLDNAVPIVIGANIGTTATALFTMIKMDLHARRTAVSHLLFNIGGAVLFLPFTGILIKSFSGYSHEIALANIHLVFNLGTSLVFVILVTPFSKLVNRLVVKS